MATTTPPILLDLYCCQGGASAGYAAAGFHVIGSDLHPQPRYPYPFAQGDALQLLDDLLDGKAPQFSDGHTYGLPGSTADRIIHAMAGSPPCQPFTLAQRIQGRDHPDLVADTRRRLQATALPWIIENVVGAPLVDPVMLCGAMFGLRTYRHRLFESNAPMAVPAHPDHVAATTKMGRPPREGEFMHVVGNFSGVSLAREVMGAPWMNRDGLRESIPPAYTEHLGRQLLAVMERAA